MKPGYIESKDQLRKRLARIEGQIGGISRMVAEERYCIDVVTQIQAAQGALDQVALGLLNDHVKHCMTGKAADRDHRVTELMDAVGRLVSR